MIDLRRVPDDDVSFEEFRGVGGFELPPGPLDFESLKCPGGCCDGFLRYYLGRDRRSHVDAGLSVPRVEFGPPRLVDGKRQAHALAVIGLELPNYIVRATPATIVCDKD